MNSPWMSRIAGIVVLSALAACASTPPRPPESDWTQVKVVEKNREGMEHLALPEEMDGCKYLGRVRTSIPSSVEHAAPEVVLDAIKREAAKKGGDTVAVLPGKRLEGNALRGSVFLCGGRS